MKISACLIVKNEKDHIRTVLESVQGVDEIVVCDTGSDDNTVEIAKEYTDKVFTDYQWRDDFAEARNHALSKCTGDWVLSIDGDEKLEQGGIQKIRELIASAKEEEKTFSVKMKGEGVDNIHFLARIFRNDGTVQWRGAAHETLAPVQTNKVDIQITYGHSTAHKKDPDRMLRILKNEVAKHPESPREKYYLAREFYYRKMWPEAIDMFSQYVVVSKWNPEKADGYLYLARCYFAAFKGDQARDACMKAIQINPDFKEALLFMADLHYEPWKRKWLQFAQLATNENVLFVRQSGVTGKKPLDMSEMDILSFKNILAEYKEIDVLEWGSGNSTKYFTEFMQHLKIEYTWDAVEHHKGWYDTVKSWNIKNVNMIFAGQDTPEYYDRKKKYDVIFIDGRNRRKCLVKAKELLKPGGTVLIHDADREYYHSGFEGYFGKFLNPKGSMPRLWAGKLEEWKQKIPKFIHQIWIGEKQPPTEWINTWKEKNPSFEHILWDEKKINQFGLKNKAIYDKYYAEKCYNGCANIARTEILERLGGIYLDADSECVESIEGASFLDWEIFSIYEADDFFVDGKKLVANGIIGCVPHHPIMVKYIEAQSKIGDINPSWRKSGPYLWTDVMKRTFGVLPAYTFLPEHHTGKKNRIDGTVYGRQYWGTSKNIYKSKE